MLWAVVHFTIPEPGLFYWINRHTQIISDSVWGFFVFLGNGWGVYSLAFPLMLFAPRILATGVISGLIAGILSRLLKHWIEYPRPAGVLDPSSFHIVGHPLEYLSLPSGHTLTAFSVATAFYFAANSKYRKVLWPLFLVALTAGVARIAVGAHWPADVFAGASVGIFSALIGVSVCHRLPASLFKSHSWINTVFVAGALVTAYILGTMQMDFELNRRYQLLGILVIVVTLLGLAAQVLFTLRAKYGRSKKTT